MDKVTNVVIIGGGSESAGILRSLTALKDFSVTALVCDDQSMPGCEAAKEAKIEIIPGLKALAGKQEIDLVIETSGLTEYLEDLRKILPVDTKIIDKETSFIIFNLARECERLLKIESAYKLGKRYSQLMEESNQRLDGKILELALLNDASKLFNTSLDPRNVSAQIYNIINKKLNVDAGCLFLFKEKEGEEEEVIITSNFALDQDFVSKVKDKLANSVSAELSKRIQQDKMLVITCQGEKFQSNGPKLEAGRFESFYSVPLMVSGSHFGYFVLANSQPNTFQSEDIKFFATLTNQMAVFIESDRVKNQIITVNLDLEKRSQETDRMNIELNKANKELEEAQIASLNIIEDMDAQRKVLSSTLAELKNVQAQLIQAGKMAAMGQLGAGIAHELNQPLAGIRGFSQIILYSLPENDPNRELLNKIVEQTVRMEKIIQSIRTFARQSTFEYRDLSINQCIDDAVMLFDAQVRSHRINLIKEYSEDLPLGFGDPNQLQQVFVNLIANSRDALDEKNQGNKEIRIKTMPQDKGKLIEIQFSDTGSGISQDSISEIFNPFFTTKKVGSGMGLGLSISHGIIENHRGSIEVESKSGEGAAFKILLPASGTEEAKLVGNKGVKK
ncbi:MAG: ATP-binding protein [Candidatus Omnitrophota bacterium]